MRIAVISDLWPPFPGGAERFIFNIARELKRRGHEISVLTSYANAAEFDGIKPTWKSVGCHAYDHHEGHTHADGWKDVEDFLNTSRAEIILTHHFFADEFKTEFLNSPIPVVQLVHNGVRNQNAALAIFNSDFTRARASAQPQDLTIIPPAFDDIVAPEHGPYIGFIKPIQHKGIDFLYQVAARLPNKEFLILHGEWQHLEDIRRGLPNVFFMPPVHEMTTFYSRCRMLLVPSLQEDAGTVPQEAALNGLPCISSNVMGLSQTNRGGIVLPLNEEAWVRAIQQLDNPTYYNQIVESQKNYIQSLDWTKQFDDLSARIQGLQK
jgi:glycosyltransferase involved in cell wall biosynthesis